MKKVVMAFGAFDGIHLGHIYYLKHAKKLGTYLIVSIARDSLDKIYSGYSLGENERLKLVEYLGIADKVILGSKTDVLKRIKQFKPDVVAVTGYHPVDVAVLRSDLEQNKINAKVAIIKKYKPKTYNRYFGMNAQKLRVIKQMGLVPRKN